jgi:TPR repeat protein
MNFKTWEARMNLRNALPFMLAAFFVVPLPAQERLPAATEALLATRARLDGMTQSSLSEVISNAHSGDREAQYLLALVYEQGRLVPRDLASVRAWMLKSAQQGYAPAQTGMGRIYLNKSSGSAVREYADADRWLRLAAMQGDADAQLWLGTGYEQGWFGVTDYHEALKWLRKAADQGQPDAQFCLGQMYQDGEGVPESDIVAARWFKKAADHFSDASGVWEAEVQLVYMYRDGRLPQDYIEAYMWFAVVESPSDSPTAGDLRKVSRHMTKAQIAEAQRRAEEWIKRHTRQSKEVTQAKQ